MNNLLNRSSISVSQKISAYKIEDFLLFYLVCKMHIKSSKKMENGIFIFEKMEPVESNKLKTWTGLQFSSHYKT